MTPTRDELLPCPFCPDGKPFVHECDWCEPHEFNGACNCGAMTRSSTSREEAVANWNRRTRPEAQGETPAAPQEATPQFETWLRTVCFQKPTPEAYDLARCAWNAVLHAKERELVEAQREAENLGHALDRITYAVDEGLRRDDVELAIKSIEGTYDELTEVKEKLATLQSVSAAPQERCSNCGATRQAHVDSVLAGVCLEFQPAPQEKKAECPKCGSDRFDSVTGCSGGTWADGGECGNRVDPYIPPPAIPQWDGSSIGGLIDGEFSGEHLATPPAAADGFVKVPKEPTPHMATVAACEYAPNNLLLGQAERMCINIYKAMLAAAPQSGKKEEWLPIETAPRDSRRIIVGYYNRDGEWRSHEAWWRMPWEDAPIQNCWWCHDGDKTLLSADVHKGLGATHWMPLPSPPASKAEGE